MRELYNFAGWWINRRTADEKVLLCIIPMVLTLLLLMYYFGPIAIFYFFALLVLSLLAGLLFKIAMAFRSSWHEYKKEKAEEAEKIIDRLQGKKVGQ